MINTGRHSQRWSLHAIKASVLIFASVIYPSLGWSDACRQEIDRTELALKKARAEDVFVPDMQESTYAKMHRQPTAATVANARTEAMQMAEQTLSLARKQDAEGREEECLKTMKMFALPVDLR